MNDHSTTRRSDTEARLVEAARELFWAKGYEATGVAEVLERAGANAGSLYHYFGGKEELLLAVLERYEELLDPAVLEPARRSAEDPIERVFAVLAGYRDALLATGFARGCPIGSLALEVAETHPAARAGLSRNFGAWRAAIEGWLHEAADRFPDAADPAGLAAFVLTVMEGAVMQARVERSIAPFDACIEELRAYFTLMEERR